MATVTISLPDSLRAFVDEQVETRGYGNVSEYFRTLVRTAQEREAERRLEEKLLEGLDSGEGTELTRESIARMTTELLDRVGKRRRA